MCFGVLLTKALQYQNNTLLQIDRLRNQEWNNKDRYTENLGEDEKVEKQKGDERNI